MDNNVALFKMRGRQGRDAGLGLGQQDDQDL